jgi:hypothetical protein
MRDLPKLRILCTGADSRSAIDAARPLLHIHIPKCAGTTLDHILAAVAKVRGRPGLRFFGTIYGQGFSGLGKEEAWKDAAGFGGAPDWLYASGHVPFGRFPRTERAPDTVCLIRDPVRRLISMFRMGARRGAWTDATPIEEIFASDLLAPDSMVRQLSGETSKDSTLGPQQVEAALRNFSSVTYRGRMEDFDAVLGAILARHGISYVAYHRFQVDRAAAAPENEPTAAAFAPYCRLDQAFFDRANCVFQGMPTVREISIRDVPSAAMILSVSPYLASSDGTAIGSALLDRDAVASLFGR